MNEPTIEPTTEAAALPMGFSIEREENFIPAQGHPAVERRAVAVTWLNYRWLDRRGEVCMVSIHATEDADWAAVDLVAAGNRIRQMVRERGRLGG